MELCLKPTLRPAVLLLALALGTSCASATPPAAREGLAERIDGRISAHPFDHATWGIHVEEEDGTVVYSHNGGKLMVPASNRKLFTTALNESCWPIDSTIATELWIEGEVSGGFLSGNVILKGYGDPSFLGRQDEGLHEERLLPFLEALQKAGIQRVLGSVVGDGSEFDSGIFHGTWQFEDLGESYQTPIDALSFNENVAGVFYSMPQCGREIVNADPAFVVVSGDLECGDEESLVFASDPSNRIAVAGTLPGASTKTEVDLVSIRDASLYAAQGVQDFLARNGIVFDYPARAGVPTRNVTRVASIESPILAELLATMMKASQNLYADALFKRVAIGVEPASFERAVAIERLFLTEEAGLDPDEFSFEDGSGLSVRNLVTPRSIVTLLRWLNAPERAGANAVIFAIPGEEGTLRRRLTGLEDNVRGKTGTLSGVNALSGYVIRADGRYRYFSAIVNNHDFGSGNAARVLDAIVREIAD